MIIVVKIPRNVKQSVQEIKENNEKFNNIILSCLREFHNKLFFIFVMKRTHFNEKIVKCPI